MLTVFIKSQYSICVEDKVEINQYVQSRNTTRSYAGNLVAAFARNGEKTYTSSAIEIYYETHLILPRDSMLEILSDKTQFPIFFPFIFYIFLDAYSLSESK